LVRLQAAFAEIDRSVARTVGSNRETLRVAVCSSFAPGWLIGRLSSFIAANPSIDLQLRMYAQDRELTDRVADAFVTTLPSEPGFVTLKLQTEVLVPVLAPCHHPFLPGKVPLITTDLEPERFGDDWKRYCAITGLDIGDFESPPWLQVSHFVLALEMARNGLGVALVPDFLAARDLAAGTLSLFGPGGVGTDEDYYFCIKHSRRAEPGLQALSQWFRSQVNGRYANA
jgi:DNA-binding transcriptional LysR family regulator